MSGLETLWFFLIFVSTGIFYGWILVWGGGALYAISQKKPIWMSALFATLASVPCLWVGAIFANSWATQRQAEAFLINSGNLPHLSHAPRTLVVHDGRTPYWQDRLVEIGAFDEVFVTWGDKAFRITNAKNARCKEGVRSPDFYRARMAFLVCPSSTPVAHVPDDGLHLYVNDKVHARVSGVEWQRALELRLIDGRSVQTIGFWGQPMVAYPSTPPVFVLHKLEMRVHVIEPPFYGEIPFLLERTGMRLEDLKPRDSPSPEEVRAEFIRLRDSPAGCDQHVAGLIAAAVGASVLSEEDVAPVLMSFGDDFASGIGFDGFCETYNRICDFPERFVAACKLKHRMSGPRTHPCDFLPRQCDWCRRTPQCHPELTGSQGCTGREKEAAEATLRALRNSVPR